jgi:cytoskeleton protein RodZ
MADEAAVGAELRAARLAAGLSVDDVAHRLNLRGSIVEAIEDGDGSAVIGEVYARSHIKTMAAMFGLPWADDV